MKLLRRLSAPIAALGLATGMLVIAQAPASAAEAGIQVVVKSTPKSLRYGQSVTIAGQTLMTAGGQSGYVPTSSTSGYVFLQRRLAGTTAWVKASATDTSPGNFSFTAPAVRNAYYRVYYSGGSYSSYTMPAKVSAQRLLLVRRNLNDRLVRSGGFYIRGDVNPGGGLMVHVERKTCAGCAYRLYKSVRSGSAGKYSVKLGVPRRGSWYYRAYVKADSAYTRSPSNKYYRIYRY